MNLVAVGGSLNLELPAGISQPTPGLRTIDPAMLGRALMRFCAGKRVPLPESPAPSLPGPGSLDPRSR